ncbi:MAG: cation-translocating P-type ATPase, partial [Clostridia bacterium]|nr:cation-translocating P-type ATPase [Clostridia bacterium]
LAIIIMVISVIVFGLTLWRNFDAGNVLKSVLNSFTFAIALAVAAIPEALGSIVTIVQAVGTSKMAKQNAIIKDLSAVETLGAVSVICSDKTGTLTQNKMTTQEVYVNGKFKRGEDIDKNEYGENMLLHEMVLVNDSTHRSGDGIGDPTEIALTILGEKHGIDELEYRKQYPRISELAFDSDRKLMSIASEYNGKQYMFTKGALDVILNRVDSIIDCGKIRKFTPNDKKAIENANLELSQKGLRVLTFAFKEFNNQTITIDDEYNYTFVGLVSMIDPPREESIEAVRRAKIAGIKTIMITGDHKITAGAIAKQIGIMDEDDIALNGVELDKMSDEQLNNILDKVTVYARVSPENKIRIVEAWQKRGNIVSMTGDGVNDSPALKKADIGVAMGITGTEVSKDAASMILTDDNFATIVNSVANGRCVYNNIRNAVTFLLSGNLAGIFCILLTSVMGWNIPFTTIHLLFINLLTDSLPAIAIGMEPASSDLLLQKPRNPKEPLLSKNVLLLILTQGLLIFGATMGAFSLGKYVGMSDSLATTMSFLTITLARLFHGFNCRGKSSVAKLGIHTNRYVVGALGIGILLMCFVTFVPGLNVLFEISAELTANPKMIGYIVLFAILPTVVIQIAK